MENKQEGTPTPQTKEERKEAILIEIEKTLRDNCEIEINLETLDGINDASDLYTEHVEEAINYGSEIIYYSRAMEFLQENDPSLRESLEIASEFGYSLEDLNSEKLASLLNYRQMEESFRDRKDELEGLIDEWHEIDEEEGEQEEINLADAWQIIAENLVKMHENL